MTAPVLEAPRPPRSPWQLVYGGVHALRRRWYASRALRLPRPVISLGNLHWGGTGKTPLVAAVAAHLCDRGLFPAILTRGYGGKGDGVRIVSTGEGPLLGPRVAGDEPVLLAGDLPGVAVVVGPERYAAGHHALERLTPAPGVFVLDDGFSHLRLGRDLDLLASPADDPFGGGRLFPGGRLREPLVAAARADAVILTESEPGAGQAFAEALRPSGFSGPGFSSRIQPQPARMESGRELDPGSTVFLVAAIARPERFTQTVQDLGFEIAGSLTFPDHHPYPQRDLAQIEMDWRQSGAEVVLTTSKDRIKLSGRLEIPLAELPIRAEPEAGFWDWLDQQLDQWPTATDHR